MSQIERLEFDETALSNLCSEFGVQELLVFGSVLRDDFNADSDVDFLVTFEQDRKTSLFDLVRLQHRLEALLDRRVDLIPKEGLKPLLRDDVLSTAQLVYAA